MSDKILHRVESDFERKKREMEEKTMKKDEAIKYITEKGFTKRVAGKIYAQAVADLEVDVAAVNNAIKENMNKMFDNEEE